MSKKVFLSNKMYCDACQQKNELLNQIHPAVVNYFV